MKPEDLFVECVLVSVYPGENPAVTDCAKKLAATILGGVISADWGEVRRLAKLPEYRNFRDGAKLVQEMADELKIKNPLDSD